MDPDFSRGFPFRILNRGFDFFFLGFREKKRGLGGAVNHELLKDTVEGDVLGECFVTRDLFTFLGIFLQVKKFSFKIVWAMIGALKQTKPFPKTSPSTMKNILQKLIR